MISQESIMEIIVNSSLSANEAYLKWSSGSTLFDYGVEALLSSSIARAIYKSQNNVNITLEESFSNIEYRNNPESNLENRQGDYSTASKADVVVWRKDDRPLGVIELKRFFNYSNCKGDISRICHLLERNGLKNSGTLRWGAIAALRHFWTNSRSDTQEIVDEFKKNISELDEKYISKWRWQEKPVPKNLSQEDKDGNRLERVAAIVFVFTLRP
jgi:hypothetical protein